MEDTNEDEYPREEFPLHRLTKTWRQLIKRAEDHKKEKFDKDAAEAMAFFRANVREMDKEGYLYGQEKYDPEYGPVQDHVQSPPFKMCVAKVSEIVQLFGPSLYQRNPYRQVTPRQTMMEAPMELFMPPQALMPNPMAMQDPMLQQAVMQAQMQYQQLALETQQQQMRDGEVARLLGKYLNYTPRELKLRRHARKVIDEALIKGMGVFWHELYHPYPDSPALVGSFYDTVDNLLLDPDAETLEDAKWIARKRIRPYWEVAAEFGFKPEVARRKLTSKSSAQNEAMEEAHDEDETWYDDDRKQCDLVTYYEIYSKMGMGDLSSLTDEEVRGTLEDFGQFCRIVIHKTYKHPLNMKKKLVGLAGEDERATQKLLDNVRWPVPFWADGEWPCTMLAFHEQPNCIWPISHVKPGLAELKFLNWAMGYLANKVRDSSRTLMACPKALADEFKQSLKSAVDYGLLEIPMDFQQDISRLITFLQGPDFKIDLYKVIEAIADQFDKRVGLSEILYGMSNTQDRSATETMTKNENASSRINDMLDLTEEAMTECARKEAFMARWLLTGDDIAPYIGRVDAMMWDNFVTSTEIEQVVREFEYTLEADSGRKPNRNTQIAMMDGAMQTLMPFFQQLAFGGNVEPYNALVESWGKLNGFVNVERLLVAPPPPPPQMMPPEQGGEVPPEQMPPEQVPQ